jgi:hypothetical protein
MREASNTVVNLEKLGEVWCGLMHDAAMWPINGQYECRTCGRHYPVPWSVERPFAAVGHAAALRPAER